MTTLTTNVANGSVCAPTIDFLAEFYGRDVAKTTNLIALEAIPAEKERVFNQCIRMQADLAFYMVCTERHLWEIFTKYDLMHIRSVFRMLVDRESSFNDFGEIVKFSSEDVENLDARVEAAKFSWSSCIAESSEEDFDRMFPNVQVCLFAKFVNIQYLHVFSKKYASKPYVIENVIDHTESIICDAAHLSSPALSSSYDGCPDMVKFFFQTMFADLSSTMMRRDAFGKTHQTRARITHTYFELADAEDAEDEDDGNFSDDESFVYNAY